MNVGIEVKVDSEQSYQEYLIRLRDEVETKQGRSCAQLAEERRERIHSAIRLKEPDRVPVIFGWHDFAAKYCGLPYSAAYYEPIQWKAAFARMMVDFAPDTCRNVTALTRSGAVLDTLKAKNILWPGGTLPDDVTQQAIDGEWLREDEYDLFLEDSSDFMLRKYFPRVYGALAPLAKLPEMTGRGSGLLGALALFDTPEFAETAAALKNAAKEEKNYRQATRGLTEDLVSIGFPSLSEGGGAGGPAFDLLANNYRGWKGIVMDMYRRPDKLIAVLEKINGWQISRAVPSDSKQDTPQIGGGGAIHRGSDTFLSKQQWEKFYWPTWKKSLQASIALGYIPLIFAEGCCDSRLEYFLEFPRGSLIVRLDSSDIFRAKEILGGQFCLMGNVPHYLLQMGSSSDIEDYCKKLIQKVGKNGGFILRGATDAVPDAKVENVRAMIESTKKFSAR